MAIGLMYTLNGERVAFVYKIAKSLTKILMSVNPEYCHWVFLIYGGLLKMHAIL